MKILLKVLVVLLVIPAMASAQHKKHRKKVVYNEAVEDSIYRKHFECFYSAKYTAAQRKVFYPFSLAAKIELINCMAPIDHLIDESDTAKANAVAKPLYTKLVDGSWKINRLRVHRSVILNEAEVDSLTDILYNYGYTPVRKTSSELINEPTGCYEPRNAILFIGEDGKIKEWIEYCFTCSGSEKSSEKIRDYDFCNEKYGMLRNFFSIRNLTPYLKDY